MSTPVLEMLGITKYFGEVAANKDITLAVHPGEIHGLLGENGAGKTTLMNILYGLYRPDSGTIKLWGKAVDITSPRKAMELGIGMVHQHFMLVPNLTVAENVIVGQTCKGGFLFNKKRVHAKIMAKAKEYGIEIDPGAKVGDLPVGAQQRVEVFKALFRGAKILILDEPTAVLTPEEVNQMFKLLRDLSRQGHAIICITHKLHEVKALCERVTVLRAGKVVGHYLTREVSADELASLMVGGRAIKTPKREVNTEPGPAFLRLEELRTKSTIGDSPLDGLSLEVRRGEIMGIAGVDGNGQTNLAHCLAGLIRPVSGKIILDGREIQGWPVKKIAREGVAYIPADRHGTATVMGMNVAENLMARDFYCPPYCYKGLLQWRNVEDYARQKIDAFEIKTPSPWSPLSTLSGGNQQKVVLAREISRKPRLIIAHQPTRGLDIGSTNYIHRVLLQAAAEGVTVIVLSTELEELLAICDRIAVLYRGRIAGVLPARGDHLGEIGLLMAGGNSRGRVAI